MADPCKPYEKQSNMGRPVVPGQRTTTTKNGVFKRAAVVAYEEAYGPVPPGHVVHHTCENQWCVEPTHLVAITSAEHIRLHGLPGDHHQAAKTHCPKDHPYAGTNLYVAPNGDRHCRVCRNEAKRRYRAKAS